ncbi:hypothetical protein GQ607_007855 [Colletotrichum asianum]|uniref:Uncharacterized protein n=1 Tax=Colletotrichum asianum TaxID=702518 RepID=A0A8H3WI15_9PEZI|nr:hypothetical protein GQ607_007855 [Colletotrichum asianum]
MFHGFHTAVYWKLLLRRTAPECVRLFMCQQQGEPCYGPSTPSSVSRIFRFFLVPIQDEGVRLLGSYASSAGQQRCNGLGMMASCNMLNPQ